MATIKTRKVFFFNFSSCILCQFEYTSPGTQNIAWWPWQTFHWWRSWSPLPRFPWGCPCPGRGLSAPPSPSRTRRNPPEQSLVNRRMQTRLYVVVSEPFLETAAMGIGFLSQWKKHYFCRGIQDILFFRGTGSLRLALREKLFLYLLSFLDWSNILFFHPASQSQQCANILKV